MRACITTFFLFCYCAAFPQRIQEKKARTDFMQFGIGVGYGQRIGLSGFSTLKLPNNGYVGIHFIVTSYKALNLPDSYRNLIRSRPDPPPNDGFTCFSALTGKKFQKKKSYFLFSVESGISLVIYNELDFNSRRSFSLFSGYSTENHLHYVPGALLGSRVDCATAKRMALGLSIHGSINTVRCVGFGTLSLVFTGP